MARRPTSFSLRRTDDRHRRAAKREGPRRGDPGRGRRAVQAARLRLPLVGDLRGARLHLSTTGTTASCSRTTSRTSGGERCCRSATTWSPSTRRILHAPARLGGLRPPGGLHRPAGRLPHLQAAASGPTSWRTRAAREKPSKQPGEGADCDLTESRQFNLMFETQVGPGGGHAVAVYLRPETAQGIFVNFKNVLEISRVKPPFGIAQIGKAFRNEITTGNFIFRTREFEQMEMEFFVPPGTGATLARALDGGPDAVVHGPRRPRPTTCGCARTTPDELSHYSSATSDVEYLFPMGWSELEGIANRGDFDLASTRSSRARSSSTSTRRRRGTTCPRDRARRRRRPLAAHVHHRRVRGGGEGTKATVLRLHPRIAPVQGRRASRSSRRTGMPGGRAEIFEELRRADVRPSTTRAARSASATAARTRSAPRGASPWTARRSRTARSRCATATRWSRSGWSPADGGDGLRAPARASRGRAQSWADRLSSAAVVHSNPQRALPSAFGTDSRAVRHVVVTLRAAPGQ